MNTKETIILLVGIVIFLTGFWFVPQLIDHKINQPEESLINRYCEEIKLLLEDQNEYGNDGWYIEESAEGRTAYYYDPENIEQFLKYIIKKKEAEIRAEIK